VPLMSIDAHLALAAVNRAPELKQRSHAHGQGRPGRQTQTVRQQTLGNGTRCWKGDGGFYVQIERCHGVAKKCASVRHDEDKYQRYTDVIKDAIEQFFDRQIPVEVIDVPTLYALEIRIMPEEQHPKYGPASVGKDAELAGAHTVFSKLETKKWPQREVLLQSVREFCRVPISIAMFGRELTAPPGQEGTEVLERHRAVNQACAGTEQLAALRRVEFSCFNDRGTNVTTFTGAGGRADVALYPGTFHLSFPEGSPYDKLTPNTISVPAHLSLLEVTIIASMKKRCTFTIVDHLGRPFGQLPLCLTHRNPRIKPMALTTKHDGKVRLRLGRGVYTVSYDGGTSNPKDWPVVPLAHQIEVHDTDVPQSFAITVQRLRFSCEVILRTRFEEPVSNCPFRIKDSVGDHVSSGLTSDIGVALCEVLAGTYSLELTPGEESPFVATRMELKVNEDASFEPLEKTVLTKVTEVRINLVTPDGEPAPDCVFWLEAQFTPAGGSIRARELKCQADESGVASSTMSLLESYVFRVKPTGKAAEYMPQHFVFQTDRREVTIVVARSIFGTITEDKIALVVDTSGSMQVYLDDIKIALNGVLTEQLFQSKKQFNIVSYTQRSLAFRPAIVDCTQENLEDAMRFCDAFEAGGGSELLKCMEHAFNYSDLDAMYIVTDGKTEMKEHFLNQVRSMYFTHPKRPKLHVIGINCVPRRMTWQGLQAIALLTQGTFRPVCLEQACIDAAPPPAMFADSMQFSGVDLAPAFAEVAEGGSEEDENTDAYESP